MRAALLVSLWLTHGATVLTAQRLDVEELRPGVFAVLSPQGHEAAANAGFVVADDGVIVIDTHMVPRAAERLIERIRVLTPLPVRYVINTHWHPDHTHGNEAYQAAFGNGVRFVSHHETRRAIDTLGRARLARERVRPELSTLSLVLPNLVFSRRLTLGASGRKVEVLFFGRGHTEGDAVVYLPDERVAFVGDLITGGPPFARDGYPFAWIETLDALGRLDVDVFVGGHGRIWREPSVVSNRKRFLEHATEVIAAGARAGHSAERIAETIDLERFRDTFEREPENRPWKSWMLMLAERGLSERREGPRQASPR